MINRWLVKTLLLLMTNTVWGVDSDLSQYFGKSYAVVIGISHYQHNWANLDNAENDAKAMVAFFKEQGFEVKSFLTAQATKENITAYLENELANKVDLNDRIVVYFSGHGTTISLGGRDRGFIVPFDGVKDKPSTLINMEKLQDFADELGKARHQLFILDSCFGGSFATKGEFDPLSAIKPNNSPGYLSEITKRIARQYLAAGGKDENTPDKPHNLPGYEQFSHYTAYILKGLLDGDADFTRDGVITASELFAYLQPAAAIPNVVTPTAGTFKSHQQGDFVFRSPKPAIETKEPPPFSSYRAKGSENTPNDDESDWHRFKPRGRSGWAFYLELHPDGAWADDARRLLDLEQAKRAEVAIKKLPSSPVPVPDEEVPAIASATYGSGRRLTVEEQAQAEYEWQQDFRHSNNSWTIEQFLKQYPTGRHVQPARQRIEELRALGR
jgi:hypothetical protein